MCRLCRKNICDSCSRFLSKDEMEQYNWCQQWISNQFPSFITFVLHDNQTRLCYHCFDWNDQQSNVKSKWILLMNDSLSIQDMIQLSKTDTTYNFLTNLILKKIQQNQTRALQINVPLKPREKRMCLVDIKHSQLRERWNFISTQTMCLNRQTTIIDTMELLWKLRQCNLNATQMRTVWGQLWQNQNPSKTRLLYYLVKELELEQYIPQNLERIYGMDENRIRSWTNWILSPDKSTIPNIETPIWNECISDTTQSISINRFPSATNPIMIRWGSEKKGLLWKQESGSVD